MIFNGTRQANRTMVAVVATLALGISACQKNDTQPAPGRSSQNLEAPGANPMPERSAQNTAGDTMGRAADTPARGGEHVGKVLDDATLTAKVKTALVSEPNLKSTTINVDTMGGVVTLKGTAASQEVRRKAEQIASAVDGVRSVRNELIVVRG